MNQGLIWGSIHEKTRGRKSKSRATVPLIAKRRAAGIYRNLLTVSLLANVKAYSIRYSVFSNYHFLKQAKKYDCCRKICRKITKKMLIVPFAKL
jgi:hypothetical protein